MLGLQNKIKYSRIHSTPPTLLTGELAYSYVSKNLFIGNPDNINSPIIITNSDTVYDDFVKKIDVNYNYNFDTDNANQIITSDSVISYYLTLFEDVSKIISNNGQDILLSGSLISNINDILSIFDLLPSNQIIENDILNKIITLFGDSINSTYDLNPSFVNSFPYLQNSTSFSDIITKINDKIGQIVRIEEILFTNTDIITINYTVSEIFDYKIFNNSNVIILATITNETISTFDIQLTSSDSGRIVLYLK